MCTRYVYSDTLHLTWLFWGEFLEMIPLSGELLLNVGPYSRGNM